LSWAVMALATVSAVGEGSNRSTRPRTSRDYFGSMTLRPTGSDKRLRVACERGVSTFGEPFGNLESATGGATGWLAGAGVTSVGSMLLELASPRPFPASGVLGS
jgi:hypothetical protein